MKIIRSRIGFANNSSSSHSIIMLRDASGIKESSEDTEFNWNNFTLKSKHDKLSYLATMLKMNDYTKEDASEFGLGEYWQEDDDNSYDYNHIDHESVWTIPKEFGSIKPCKKFCEALIEYFNNDNTVVFGGNDNSDGHPDLENLDPLDIVSSINIPDSYGKVVCKVIANDVFVFFNENNGDKKAYSLDKRITDYTPDTPELIDVKITNFCSIGVDDTNGKELCRFCYMGSSPKGKHASLDKLEELSKEFAKMQVLEVALGGGSPEQHPDFIKILKMFREKGITPNFTTRNFEFFEDSEPEVIKEILDICGSFAFSIQSKAEADRVWAIRNKHKIEREQIYLQVIPALFLGEVADIYNSCTVEGSSYDRMNITFLGYKTTGRGGEYTDLYKQREMDLIKVLKSTEGWKKAHHPFGIDTILANKLKDVLRAEGVNKNSYYLEEGRFSYYVDAVGNKMGKCSYTEELKDYDIDELKRHFKNIACIEKLKEK